jgi:putative transposase
MHEGTQIEGIVRKAPEKHRIVQRRRFPANVSRFNARGFFQFIRLVGVSHVPSNPYGPHSHGKLFRWHGSIKRDCRRPACPGSVAEPRRRMNAVVETYNTVRVYFLSESPRLGRQAARSSTGDLSGTRSKTKESRRRRQVARRLAGPHAEGDR